MKITKQLFDHLCTLESSELDERGRELPNPKPLVLDLSGRPPTLKEQIKRVLREEISQQAMEQGFETWEESHDFDVEDEFDVEPSSAYEIMEDEVPIADLEPATSPEPEEPAPEEGAEPEPEVTEGE